MNVYELTVEYERIEGLLETIEMMKADGEAGLEQFEATTLENFSALKEAIGDKMDNIGKLICNIETEAAAKKAEAKRLTESAKRAENKVKYLKTQLIKPMLEATDKKKLTGDLFAFSLRKSTAVEITDESILDEKYMIEKVTRQPDKKAIKETLKTRNIFGAKLVENFSVQIK